eukprot:CAMPEP_0175084644 /NCGR_PEP_ID=MMETSP0052_2-20121109/28185_1 /TAXON_ID=51329 ORGANISM="Polytomella parva, Strain SAG 63-3" /NCGR_SAMPLE_ID=MMETSP0052_2 /ASSEMBLY_ACC=CAM_ASM_000194 /LENGTH=164 /DNA_ID=CAMNT_0016356493 /DNA_START=166 /DNA_END=660 /DNA_ORIENTATION=+
MPALALVVGPVTVLVRPALVMDAVSFFALSLLVPMDLLALLSFRAAELKRLLPKHSSQSESETSTSEVPTSEFSLSSLLSSTSKGHISGGKIPSLQYCMASLIAFRNRASWLRGLWPLPIGAESSWSTETVAGDDVSSPLTWQPKANPASQGSTGGGLEGCDEG